MIHWNSFSEFLAMGGYGLYVWGSFGVTALSWWRNRSGARQKSVIARLKRQFAPPEQARRTIEGNDETRHKRSP
jgi:heme exporter protein D